MTTQHDAAHESGPISTPPTTNEGTQAHHHGDFDWAAHLTRLKLGEEAYEPLFEQVALWLSELRGFGPVGCILDIGSGAGVISGVLARVFPNAEVVAVDASPVLLQEVRARAELLGLSGQIQVLEASLPEDAGRLPQADLIWASDALHHLGDQQAAIDLMHGQLSPGGLLAVCEGGLPARYVLSEMGLGRPGLQARLDAATADVFSAIRSTLPGAVISTDDWPDRLRASGAREVRSRSFLLDIPSPLDAPTRDFVIAEFAALCEWLTDRLDATDRETIARLLDDEDPQGLRQRQDLFILAARTVYTARSASL